MLRFGALAQTFGFTRKNKLSLSSERVSLAKNNYLLAKEEITRYILKAEKNAKK